MFEAIGSDILILGSFLNIPPISHIVMAASMSNGKIIRVGTHKTPLDDTCIKINAEPDVVMQELMNQLNLETPEFKIKREV